MRETGRREEGREGRGEGRRKRGKKKEKRKGGILGQETLKMQFLFQTEGCDGGLGVEGGHV